MPYVFNPFTGTLDWTDSGSGVPYTGATQNVNLGEYGITTGFVTFDTTPTTATGAVGEISWDDGNGTASMVLKGGNTTLAIGEQEYVRVYNDSGTTLTKGQVVYISGAQGNRVAVKLAQADSELTSRGTLGFASETITAGAEGFIIHSGPLYKLNTDGLTQGQPLYLSATTPGAYTTTAPTSPNHLVILGWVERVSTTVGSIFVKIDNGYELGELHDVQISSVQNNNVLKYVGANSRWENSSTLALTGLTLSNFTSGSVLFAGTAGAITEDNRNLNWQATNRWLSVSSTFQERVTNGSFSGSATGWSLPTGWAYSSNSVSHNANGTGALTQTVTVNLGERFELTFTLSNVTAGGVLITFNGTTYGSYSTAGTYIVRGEVAGVSGVLSFGPTINTARFTIDDVSLKVLSGGRMVTGDMYVQGSATTGVLTVSATNKSNGQPGTTKHISLENAGSNTWVDFKFSGIDRGHIGANSSGEVSTWVSGGNYDAVYNKSTGTLISYNTPGAFGHYGYGLFQSGVNAGGIGNPSSTLMSQGGTALKVKYINASQTLDNTATEWIVDPSTAVCTGVPTNACSSYTNETDCLNRDAHGGCTWFAGYSCSTYNGDQSGCESQSGCTYEQASCSAYGDETSCNSVSGCSWTNNPQDCSVLDETTCGSTSGCTQNFDDCSNYSDGGGDGTACNAANGGGYCSYDSGTGACTGGSWYVSCSGSYDSYSCVGSYYTGNCTGTYGAACSGTAACGGIDDSTNCNAEPGCTWQTAITLTLPAITTCLDRDYWIYNTSSTNADVVIVPTGGDSIDHTTSYTLSNYKDWVHISPLRRTQLCNGFDESTCGSTSGCTSQYSNCSWNSIDSLCEGDPSCSGYGDQSSCQMATYFSGCTGSYVTSSNWYVFGR
jgi:hypothetical protein